MNIRDKLPKLLSKDELVNELSNYPKFVEPQKLSGEERIIRTQDIYDVYIPNKMSMELYNQIYLLLFNACKRKENRNSFRSINDCECSLFVGITGIGKTEAVSRINKMMFHNQVIRLENPYLEVVPILIVQSSTIQSFKSFLITVLFEIDEKIKTSYSSVAKKNNVTTDELLICTSKALCQHVLLLVIEECNFLNEKVRFANSMVALTNLVDCSILFVCTPVGLNFFTSSDYLLRRAMGRPYLELDFDDDFKNLTRELLRYNYTLRKVDINQNIIRLLYKFSNGVPAYLKVLISYAQIWAIQNGYERLDEYSIKQAANVKLSVINPSLYSANRLLSLSNDENTKPQIIDEKGRDVKTIRTFKEMASMSLKSPKNMINHISSIVDVEIIQL